MNLQTAFSSLPPEIRQQLFALLNQGPQEMEQNNYPPVNGEIFSRKIKVDRQTNTLYAADGRMLPHNPKQIPASHYKHQPFPKMLYKISEYQFETIMVDPKTTEEKLVKKQVRTKDAAKELVDAGWTPCLITKTVGSAPELTKELKRGWLESPESFIQLVEAYPEE